MDLQRKTLGIFLVLALAGPLCCCQLGFAAGLSAADSPKVHSCCETSQHPSDAPDDRPCDSCSATWVRSTEASVPLQIIPQWFVVDSFLAPEFSPPQLRGAPGLVRHANPAIQAPPPPLYLLQRRFLI